jgi:hypothetical protein
MCRLLFVVEDRFLIKGRGVVPLPGFIPEGHEIFRPGDPVLLRRPDGSSLCWRIGGIELMTPPSPRNDVVILLQDLGMQDLPIGTEVWSQCSQAPLS